MVIICVNMVILCINNRLTTCLTENEARYFKDEDKIIKTDDLVHKFHAFERKFMI